MSTIKDIIDEAHLLGHKHAMDAMIEVCDTIEFEAEHAALTATPESMEYFRGVKNTARMLKEQLQTALEAEDDNADHIEPDEQSRREDDGGA